GRHSGFHALPRIGGPCLSNRKTRGQDNDASHRDEAGHQSSDAKSKNDENDDKNDCCTAYSRQKATAKAVRSRQGDSVMPALSVPDGERLAALRAFAAERRWLDILTLL